MHNLVKSINVLTIAFLFMSTSAQEHDSKPVQAEDRSFNTFYGSNTPDGFINTAPAYATYAHFPNSASHYGLTNHNFGNSFGSTFPSYYNNYNAYSSPVHTMSPHALNSFGQGYNFGFNNGYMDTNNFNNYNAYNGYNSFPIFGLHRPIMSGIGIHHNGGIGAVGGFGGFGLQAQLPTSASGGFVPSIFNSNFGGPAAVPYNGMFAEQIAGYGASIGNHHLFKRV